MEKKIHFWFWSRKKQFFKQDRKHQIYKGSRETKNFIAQYTRISIAETSIIIKNRIQTKYP